jgi:hypothetical protein
MPRKQLEVPPAAAKSFVKDMRAFFREKNLIKRDGIAAQQAWSLTQHLPGLRIRTHEVKEMFFRMRDQQ